MTAMDRPLRKVNSWNLCELGSHLLSMGVQNELPGWMHGALGKRPAEQRLQATTGNGEGNRGGDEKPSQFLRAS